VEFMNSLWDVVEEAKPQVVHLTHGGDVHSDHQAVFRAATAILKPWHMAHFGVRRVLCYETLSPTEAVYSQDSWAFNPNVFADISPFIDCKLEIMESYQSESQPDPLPRGPSSIRALARHRGATIGVEYAEGFMLVRELL
jgi:LmbE family N-acetylglucosaminyl deacetylase